MDMSGSFNMIISKDSLKHDMSHAEMVITNYAVANGYVRTMYVSE